MRQKDGTYTPEGIKGGTKGCHSCLDPEAVTVSFTGYDGVTFDVCFVCLSTAETWWFSDPALDDSV